MAEPFSLEEKERIEHTILTAIEMQAAMNKAESSRLAGISHTELNNLLDQRPSFARRFQAAIKAAREHTIDNVESVMVQRALDPKNPTGVTAGIFLLKAHKPKLYGDKVSASAGGITVNIDKAQINLERQTTEEMRALEGPEDE